ncbi:MAG: hypothetical protein ABIE94_01975 [archaeon]
MENPDDLKTTTDSTFDSATDSFSTETLDNSLDKALEEIKEKQRRFPFHIKPIDNKKSFALMTIFAFGLFFAFAFLYLQEPANITAFAISGNETIANATVSGTGGLFGMESFRLDMSKVIIVSVLAAVIMIIGQSFAFVSYKDRKSPDPKIRALDDFLESSLYGGDKAEDILQYLLLQGWTKKTVGKRLKRLQNRME